MPNEERHEVIRSTDEYWDEEFAKQDLVETPSSQQYPAYRREEAILLYLTLGNMGEVSEKLDIPIRTLENWKATDWWKQRASSFREAESIRISQKLKTVVGDSLAALQDRVKNGDFYYNKFTGKMERIPVKASEINKIFSTSFDRKVISDKMVTAEESLNRERENKRAEEKLNMVIQKMMKLVRVKDNETYEGEIIDVDEDQDVVP